MAGGPYNLPSTDRLSPYTSLFSVYFQIIKKHTHSSKDWVSKLLKKKKKKTCTLYISCKRQKPQDIVYFNLQILNPKSVYVCMCVMEEQSNPKVKSLEPPIQYLLSSSAKKNIYFLLYFIFHSGHLDSSMLHVIQPKNGWTSKPSKTVTSLSLPCGYHVRISSCGKWSLCKGSLCRDLTMGVFHSSQVPIWLFIWSFGCLTNTSILVYYKFTLLDTTEI